jgi:hypothetical protein
MGTKLLLCEQQTMYVLLKVGNSSLK